MIPNEAKCEAVYINFYSRINIQQRVSLSFESSSFNIQTARE